MADAATASGTELGPPLYEQVPAVVRQMVLLVALAGAVAAGVALVLWSQSPAMTPLYTGLTDRDASEIIAVVEGAGVEYELDAGTGSVLVPSDSKYDLRMQLASSGLPRGAGFGIEDIPGMSTLGQTPFIENALYKRALETELARTISSVSVVDSARVHLGLPERSGFLRRQREPTASVFLTLFPGRRLDRGQVQGVVNLVAAAVPELNPQRVKITDQSGALLTNSDDDTVAGLTNSQFDYTRQLEEDYASRIENLLAPVVGPERVRATVAADLDFTVTEETRETFDPNVTPVRSEQTSEETLNGGDLAQGVPGALSNQPPQAQAGGAGQTPGQPASTTVSAVRNFEIDKTIAHVKQPVGSVRRLSIAVLLDYRTAGAAVADAAADGEAAGGGEAESAAADSSAVAMQPVSQEELDALTELVQQAVGFDEVRGDTISLQNVPFAEPPEIEAPEPMPIWQQPWVLDIARQALGAVLVLTLALVVLRPMMRTLTRPQPIAASPAVASAGIAMDGGQAGVAVLPEGAAALPAGFDDRLVAAQSVAGQDPRQVAQVVKNWVAEDDG